MQIAILPLQGACGLIDAYLFQFEDETGSIEVLDNGECKPVRIPSTPNLVLTPVRAGEQIAIATLLKSPSHPPGTRIHAQLRGIKKLPERVL